MYNSELYHHGILGQRWGVRRYQNKDGTLTDAGIRRYGISSTNDQKVKGKTKRVSRTNGKQKKITINAERAKSIAESARKKINAIDIETAKDRVRTLYDRGQQFIESPAGKIMLGLGAGAGLAAGLAAGNAAHRREVQRVTQEQQMLAMAQAVMMGMW